MKFKKRNKKQKKSCLSGTFFAASLRRLSKSSEGPNIFSTLCAPPDRGAPMEAATSVPAVWSIFHECIECDQGEEVYGGTSLLSRRLQCQVQAGFRTILSTDHPTFLPTCSLVYVSIIIYPAEILPLRHSLASLALQVPYYSIYVLSLH